MEQITAVVRKLGYDAPAGELSPGERVARTAAILAGIIALFAAFQGLGLLNVLVPGQLADTKTGYGMLFVMGLITSIHCVAMCGGINLSQSIPRGESEGGSARPAMFRATFLYNAGRVISYTVVGFVLGLIGMAIGGVPPMVVRGAYYKRLADAA